MSTSGATSSDVGRRQRGIRIVALVGIALLVLSLLAFAVWWGPNVLTRHPRIVDASARTKAITDTRANLVASLIGVGALGTFAVASWNARTSREALAATVQGLEDARAAQQAAGDLARESQINERYATAAEHLGSSALNTRLGAIYAFERIALDSERDRGVVVEVLSAFVRGRGEVSGPSGGDPPAPGSDVAAAVVVLGRTRLHERALKPLDLSGADLRGLALERVFLANARLADVDLRGARLHGADLAGTWLHRAKLSGANLRGASLQGAHLGGADLRDVQGLTRVMLDGATGESTTLLPLGWSPPVAWPE